MDVFPAILRSCRNPVLIKIDMSPNRNLLQPYLKHIPFINNIGTVINFISLTEKFFTKFAKIILLSINLLHYIRFQKKKQWRFS